MAVTRIKNNQITNATINASSKVVSGSITGGLLADPFTYSGNLTVTGNLIVQGTTTTVDTTSTLINDPVIVLSRGETGTPTNDSGFLVKRGTSDNAAFLWDETNNRFEAITTTDDGLNGGTITPLAFADLKVSNLITTGLTASGLTSSRVIFSGAGGILTDDANLTFTGGNTLNITGNANVTTVNATTVNANTFGSNGATTVTIANATATTVDIGGAATAVNIGSSSGTTIIKNNLDVDGNINLDGANFTVTSATVNIANANATTVNFAGAATTLELGAATGTTNVNNNLDVDGNINLDGGNFTTTAATVNIANANTTTLNIGGAATSTNVGGANGTITLTGAIVETGNLNKSAWGTAGVAYNRVANTFTDSSTAASSTVANNMVWAIQTPTLDSTNVSVTYTNAATMYIANAPQEGTNVTLTNAYALYVAAGISKFVGNVETDANFKGNVITTNATITNITTPATNTNLTITPNGTGNVIISTATANRVFYSGDNKELLTSANFTFNGTDTVLGGDIAVNGGDITTTSSTFTVANANATTLNIGGAATAVNIGAATGTTIIKNNLDVDGDINFDGGDITTTAATANIVNANATTVNFATAATTLEIGAATGTTNVNNNLDVDGNINMDGGSLTTTAATVNIANANTTTLNIGGAASTVNIGTSTGTTTVNNDLQINGNDIKSSTGNVAISLNNQDVTVLGNLTVQGLTTNVGTQDLIVQDSLINLHTTPNLAPLVADDGRDIGVVFHYYKVSDKQAALVWANDTGALEYYIDGTESGSGTFSGTYGNIKALQYVSTATTGTAPFVVSSTTLVTNLRADTASVANTVADASQPNITSLGNLSIANIDNIQINDNTISSTNSNGNINLTPNGTGEVVAATLSVNDLTSTRVVYAGANGALTDNANLIFSGTLLTVTGSANVSSQANIANININGNTISSIDANGNVNITPNGTGDINLSADTVVFGDSNTQAILTTNGTGNLFMSTNGGTDSGNIVITQGTNANIIITPNGTGHVVIGNLSVKDNELVSTNTNANIKLVPNGTGDILLSADTTIIGDNNTDAIVTTNGTGNLTLSTNEGTNSGTIQIAQGTNANITLTPNGTGNVTIGNLAIANNNIISTSNNANINITPNGTGDINLASDTIVLGDSSGDITLTTNDAVDLIINTNNGTNAGNIKLADGANGNITITANGTGEVVTNTLAVGDLTSTRVVYAGANGALTDNANLTFSGSLLTVTGSANVSSQANIANINVSGNTISSIDTNGNINITANGTGYVIVNSAADSSDFIINGNTSVSASYANIFYVKASTGQIGVGTNSPAANVRLDMSTFKDSIMIPMGLTADRPTGTEGMVRYNTSTHLLEFHNGTAWTGTTGNFTTIVANSYNGDGSSVNFILDQDSTSAGIIVAINGVVQIPGDAYGVSGTTLTFTEAPQSGDKIDVRMLTTTATVTSISDLTTSITLSDSANIANVVIHGNTIVQVSNTAVYPGTNGTINLGKATTGRWATVYATNTSIQNADLAENYLADSHIAPGTVVSFGGNEEITITLEDMDTRVAGVVSTSPAHVMNSMMEGEHVIPLALQGRVPCRVIGTVRKGDMMVSAGNGMARAEENPKYGSVIGKALEDFDDAEGVIEIVVGRL